MNRSVSASSKEVWSTGSPEQQKGTETKKLRESQNPQDVPENSPIVEQPSTSGAAASKGQARAGPKSWKRKVARAREEKSFANVDDLLMSDSGDDTENNSQSATDNLNETEGVATNDEEEITDFSEDEFDINDLGSNNLIQQFKGGSKDRSECRTCGQVLPTPRLAQHQDLPHPLACPQQDCDKRFVLVKTLERHQKKAHTPRSPDPGLVSTHLSTDHTPRSPDPGLASTHLSSDHTTRSPDPGLASTQPSIVDRSSKSMSPVVERPDRSDGINPVKDDRYAIPEGKGIVGDGGMAVSADDLSSNMDTKPASIVEEELYDSVDNDDKPFGKNIEGGGEVVSSLEPTSAAVGEEIDNDGLSSEGTECPEPDADALEVQDTINKEDTELSGVKTGEEEQNGPFICKFCEEEYKSWAILTRHFITPHLFNCEFCPLVFNRDSSLEDHTNKFHDLVGLIDSTNCGLCGESFSRSSTLARHSAAPHNFPCRKCDKKFQTKAMLNKHSFVCLNKHLVVEDELSEKKGRGKRKNVVKNVGSGKRGRTSQKEESDGDETSEEDTTNSEPESESDDSEDEVKGDTEKIKVGSTILKRGRQSKKQGKRYIESSEDESTHSESRSESDESEDEINLSQRLKKKQKTSKTDICDENDNEKDERIITPEVEQVTEPKSPGSVCDLCDQLIKGGPKGLRAHQGRDHKFPCDICAKRFVMKSRLNVHKTNEHRSDVIEYECELCLFKIVSQSKMSITLMKNKMEKHKAQPHSFECDLCQMKFVSKDRLAYHKSQVHEEDFVSDLKCKQCDIDFSAKEDSKKTNEFLDHCDLVHKFDCEFCHLKFTTSVMTRKHFDEVHENQKHCVKCKIEFSKEVLRKHMKLLHPHDCQECDFHFVSEERLKYHMNTLHDEDQEIVTDCKLCGLNIEEIEEFLSHIEADHESKCYKCTLVFVDSTILQEHIMQVHPKKKLICCHCGLNFEEDEEAYEHHIELEHGVPCPYCPKMFIKKNALLKHVLAGHTDQVFSCKFCDKDFESDFQEYQNHEQEPHVHLCRICSKKFTKKSHMIKHVTSDHAGSDFNCTLCDQSFGSSLETCLKHEASSHDYQCENCPKKFAEKTVHDKHSLDIHGVSVGLDLQCGQCQQRFSNTGAFREHFKVPHKSFCSKCDLKFPDGRSLGEHFSKAHQSPVKLPKLVCNLCDKKFEAKEKREYTEHCNTNHKYKCDSCPKKFVKSGRLRDHIDEFHGHSKSIDDRFTCKLCKTVCNRKNDMKLSKESYKIHISLPHKFPCRSCDMRFTNKGKLDAHSQSHQRKSEGVSANECPTCSARFSDLHKLKDHKKEPHKFSCKDSKCRKKFVNESSLERHLQRKHKEFAAARLQDGKLVFRCKLCGQSFDSGSSLESHQQVPHGQTCHLCEASYPEREDLARHLKKVHRVDKIPEEGFSCVQCRFQTKRMVEIRKHCTLRHSYGCDSCPRQYTNQNQLEIHLEESHSGGNGECVEEEPPPEDLVSRLGVSVLLWAGSKEVKEYLHRVMAGQASSTRHSLYLNKQEREECCRTQDSNLYQMACPRFLNLPTSADQALLEVTTTTFRSGPPILFGISSTTTFEYVACVMVPETWLLFLTTVKGMTKNDAERIVKAKTTISKDIFNSWKDFDQTVTNWRGKTDKHEKTLVNNESINKKTESEVRKKDKNTKPVVCEAVKDTHITHSNPNVDISAEKETFKEKESEDVPNDDQQTVENLDSIAEFLEGSM